MVAFITVSLIRDLPEFGIDLLPCNHDENRKTDRDGSFEWREVKGPRDSDGDGHGEGSHSIECAEAWVDRPVDFVAERGYRPVLELTACVARAV